MSHRHSANTSFARSSAPSGTPTVASTFLPTSPTGTQATSLFEGSGYSADGLDSEDRPGTGSADGDSTSLVASSSFRSPRGDEAKLLSSASTAVGIGENEARMRANGHVGVVRVGGRDGGSVGEISPGSGIGGGIIGQRPDREVRRKSSRFRFDFWKKKKGAGGASTNTSPGAGIGQGGETSP